MRRLPFALLALLILAPLAACGGSSSSLSKAEYTKKGDAICAKLDSDFAALDTPSSIEAPESAAYLEKQAKLAETARAGFAALKPPKDGQRVNKELLDALDALIDALKGAIAAVKSGDTASAKDLLTAATSKAGDKFKAAAKDYGFKECASSS